MSNVQRWYIYIVCVISLQGVTWAIIELLRNLIVLGVDRTAVAFQIAVIVIGLPVYLVHWLRARKFAIKSAEERGATLRRLYFYATMAAFLQPVITNTYDLVRRLLERVISVQDRSYYELSFKDAIPFHLIAIVVLAVIWYYHQVVNAEDTRKVPEVGSSASVRRLFVFTFSAAGLTLSITGLIGLIRWLMMQIGRSAYIGSGVNEGLSASITLLIVGVPLWIIFWRWAQRLFYGPSEEEHASVLRKIYLYAAVLLGALDVVGNTAGILASLIRRGLVKAGEPGGDIRQPLPIIIVMGLVWIYHALVLRSDPQRIGEAPRQAGVRHLYLYLVAGVGLAALLVGLFGEISVILRSIQQSFGTELREEFAWFTAAILAGLPVWIIPWRQVQAEATTPDAVGVEARRLVVRKIYLYFFLFVATMAILGAAVFIVYRILSALLGEESLIFTELGNAISLILIAAAVGIYHLRLLRADGVFAKREKVGLLETYRLVVMDVGAGSFGSALVDLLKRENPELSLVPVILAPQAAEQVDSGEGRAALLDQIAGAGLIVGPWAIVAPGSGDGSISMEIAQAVISSPARKLLVPFQGEGWDWVGVDRMGNEAFLRQTIYAIKQVLSGAVVKAYRPMGAGAIIGIVIAVLIGLSIVTGIVINFIG